MAEFKEELKMFLVSYLCDECNEGNMIVGGLVRLSRPPKYPATCDACGHKQDLDQSYPVRTYEVI